MTEKDKEIQELRRENMTLQETNKVLLAKLTKLISGYNGMINSISEQARAIKAAIEGDKKPSDAPKATD